MGTLNAHHKSSPSLNHRFIFIPVLPYAALRSAFLSRNIFCLGATVCFWGLGALRTAAYGLCCSRSRFSRCLAVRTGPGARRGGVAETEGVDRFGRRPIEVVIAR